MGHGTKVLGGAALLCVAVLLMTSSTEFHVPQGTAVPESDRPATVESPLAVDHNDDTPKSLTPSRGDAPQRLSPLTLPRRYPMHAGLPPRAELLRGVDAQQALRCSAAADPTQLSGTPDAPTDENAIRDAKASAALEEEFSFPNPSQFVFWKLNADEPAAPDADAAGDALPCTNEIQARLAAHQRAGDSCSGARFLVSPLKAGAHGIGSAVTLVAHDFLSALLVDRVLLTTKSRWYFSPPACPRGGWDCFFAPPTRCEASEHRQTVGSLAEARRSSAKVIQKKTFDIAGLSRNDYPTLRAFLGGGAAGRCEARIKAYVADPRNTYVMGTFARGADPLLGFMMAQVTRYLMRRPQPWFAAMLRHNLPRVLPPPADGHLLYMQDRGEPAKYREYYASIGCHTVDVPRAFPALAAALCRAPDGETAAGSCNVFVSGNTPRKVYDGLKRRLSRDGVRVFSTWEHPALQEKKAGAAESSRWGAASPMSSWVDLYAGVLSSGWACIVQSNWCRVINFLRLTLGRARCPFVDLGVLMLADADARRRFCVVNSSWPSKPFSGASLSGFTLK
jgi:hypothetical protein